MSDNWNTSSSHFNMTTLFGTAPIEAAAQFIFMFISLLLAGGGNCLVITVVLRQCQLHETTYYIQLCLAVANLLFTVFNLPTVMSVLSVVHTGFTGPWCQIQGFITFTTGIASMMLYTLSSLDRLIFILHPFWYINSSWAKRPHIYIISMITFVLVIGTVPLAKQSFSFHEGMMVCTLVTTFNFRKHTYITIIGTVLFIICIFILIITQISIFLTVRSKIKNIPRLTRPLNQQSSQHLLMTWKANLKALKPISLTIIIFLLTWLAYSAVIIVDKRAQNFRNSTQFKATSRAICLVFLTLPQFCNPLIYTMTDKKFCDALTRLLNIRSFPDNNMQPQTTQTSREQTSRF
ncbi:olfactory receptor 51M1-like [Haliotis asinina]|uniref:olfactory receptor 51M1-like n=1 Tax=Haliotis asinina TaxID=109174 RepID=UPI0035326E4D